MAAKTPQKRVLFARCPRHVGAVFLGALTFVIFGLTLLFVSPPAHTYAATAPTINFQARLMNTNGAVVADGSYTVEFRVYSASSGGSPLWTEDQTLSVTNGYLTANLGSVTAFNSSIPWGSPLWLTMNVNSDGEMSPRLSLTSVPSALALVSANGGTNVSTLTFAAPTTSEQIILPAESGATETICYQSDTACGFAPSSGSGSYINNNTSIQTNANFYIQGSTGTVTGVLKANGANILNLQNSSAANVATFGATGAVTLQNSTDSTGALVVESQGGTTVLNVDTSDNAIGINSTSAAEELNVGGGVSISSLAAPSSVTVTNVGTAGSTTYTYKVFACDDAGCIYPSAGTTQTMSTGNATLTSSNYNTVSWPAVAGAKAYAVYLTAGSGAPRYVGTVSAPTVTLNDQGGGVSGVNAPTTVGSGSIVAAGSGSIGNNFTVSNNANVGRILNVGGNTVTSNAAPSTLEVLGGISAANLTAPSAPSVSVVGTTGSTTYTYYIAACSTNCGNFLGFYGQTTAASSGTQITNGNATLTSTNYNNVSWSSVSGAAGYVIYRKIGTGSIALLAVATGQSTTSYSDNGASAISSSVSLPTIDQTGNIQASNAQFSTVDTQVAGALSIATNTANALNIGNTTTNILTTINGTVLVKPTSTHDTSSVFQVQNAAGTSTIFNVDTLNGRVGIGGVAAASKLEIQGGDLAVYNNGANPRLIIGDTTSTYGFLQWDSTNDYFRIETVGTNGLKIKDNDVAIGNIFPSQPLIVGLGSTQLLQVNSSGKVAIGSGTPSYQLDVTGDINTSTAYRIGGTSVCDTTGTTGCIAKSGSGYYIHNGQGSLTAQTSANFSIQGGTGVVTGILEANGADILDLQNSSAVNVATFNSTGVLTVTGAQSADITTFNSASATANGITIRPGTSGGAASSGGTVTVQAGAGAGTGAGGLLTLQGGTGGTGAAAAGGNVQIQGGTASGTGASNGGNIILQGGTASGTGVQGQVQINGGLLYMSTTFSSGVSATITQSAVDSFTTILATATASGLTFTVPSPTLATAGRMIVISNVGATNSFILAGAGTSFSLNTGSSATLMWNGSAWTNAGVDASTLQTAYNNSVGGSTPMVQLNTTLNGITIEANSGQSGNQNFFTLESPSAVEEIGFGVTGTYFQEPRSGFDGVVFQIQQSNSGVISASKDVFSVDTTAAASVVNLGSTASSGYNGSTVNIVTTNNANGTVNIGSTSLAGSATQTINIGYTATLNGTTNVNIGAASPGAGSTTVRGAGGLTLTGGAASTWSTSAGALTIQGFAGVTLQTPATSGSSTNSSAITIQSGNATGTTSNSGNITLDVGTATGTRGTISIGSTNASAITVGNSSMSGSLALQGGSGGLNINASINATTNINTGTSTGTVNIGNTSETSNINITSGTGQTVIQASVIPLYLNSTSGTDQESAILYELNGTGKGEIGLTGTATKIINQTSINDLGVKSISGNIWLAAGGNTGQVKISGTNGSVLFQNSTDSNSALTVQNQAGTATIFTVDTSNKQIIIGGGTSDPSGVAGAMYYNSSTHQFRCYNNSQWENCVGLDSDAFRQMPFYATDFLDSGSLVSGAYIGATAPWIGYQLASGTITGGALSTQTAGHPGVVRIASSTNGSSGARYAMNGSGMFMTGGLSFELTFNVATIANTGMHIGFFDVSGNASPNNGMWLGVSGAGSTLTVNGVTGAGGSRTTTASSWTTGTANTWYRAKIVANSAATGVDFYIYDDSGNQLWHDSVTGTLPTGTANEFNAGVSAWSTNTAVTNLVDLDYMALWWSTALAR